MYTHQEIESLLQVGIKMLKAINIPVSDSINPRMEFPKAHSFYGQCCSTRNVYRFKIRFSEYALGNSHQSVMNTILHELLHTCSGCMNHQKLWQSYAAKVFDAYGYDIKRVDGDKSAADRANLRMGLSSNTYKSIKVQCTKCGIVWTRTRESRLTLHPELYRCKCGGSIIRLG